MKSHNAIIEKYRIKTGPLASDAKYGNNGAFEIQIIKDPEEPSIVSVIASDGCGWDHVSVSCMDRCPTWDEMCGIKDLFFSSSEIVIQYHPPTKDYINNHPFCLHLWRSQSQKISMPPKWMVGF